MEETEHKKNDRKDNTSASGSPVRNCSKNRSQSRSRSRSPIKDESYKRYMLLEKVPIPTTVYFLKKLIFSSLGIKETEFMNPNKIYIASDDENRHIVKFPNSEICEKAIKVMDGMQYKGKVLRASYDVDGRYNKIITTKTLKDKKVRTRSKSDKNVIQPQKFSEITNTFGLSSDYLRNLGITKIHNRVYVANLDLSVTQEHLRSVFSNAGFITDVHLAKKHDNAYANIVYDHPLEAIQAISMFHNKDWYSKTLTVIMDSKKIKEFPYGRGLQPDGRPLRYVRVMEEMRIMKNKFSSEIDKLTSTIEDMKSKMEQQSKLLMAMLIPLQNASLNTINNQISNPSLQQNLMQNMMQNQNVMFQQANPVNNQIAQVNQMPTSIGQNTSQMNLMCSVGPTQVGQISQIGQANAQLGSMAGQMSFNAGQLSQTGDQMSRASNFMGQMNQMSQVSNYMSQMSQKGDRISQESGYMSQMSQKGDRISQESGYMSQMSQKGDRMSQDSGYTGQMNQNYNKSNWSNVNSYNDNDRCSDRNVFSNSESSKEKISDMLVFLNLPPSVTDSVLINKMREIGDLKFAEITGNGKAIVRFQTESAAARCIKLYHRSKVDGQYVDVNYL